MVCTCVQFAALLVLLTCAVHAEKEPQWSKEASSRSDWVPLTGPFRDNEPSASIQHGVATILRPPEPVSVRQQRLAQAPRQGRGPPVGPQQYFPGDQTHLIRFPNEPPRFNGPQQQVFPPNFQNQPPVFLPPQPVPQGFPPTALTRPAFQPQPIPASPASSTVAQPIKQNNNSFIPAGPQEEVQLVYVPVEALQAQKNQNSLPKQVAHPPSKFRNPEEAFQDQLRNFVKQQGTNTLPNSQQLQQQEQQRQTQLNEQQERKRIQEQELRQRQEQEQRIRQEQEQQRRKEFELREKKEKELQLRKEQEARNQELRLKQEQEARLKEERERQEYNQRQQSQHATNANPQHLFAPSLQAQEQAFQQQLKSSQPAQKTETTSPAPHQPPLAVYMGNQGHKPAVIDDVLFALRDAHSIPVLDRIPNNTPPQVFVGPAEMTPPQGYTKFELPYLSSLESNRVERKVEQLPFFVAPLSFQPPNGYSKIPFPSPHVGSVVVSHGNRQHRPVSPDPVVPANDFSSEELPSISPAIPLLVNSLQSGRGAKHQRPNIEQQNLIPNQHHFSPQQQIYSSQEQQFVPNQPHFIPQQHFVQQQQPQYIPHHQFNPQQQYDTQQQFGPLPTPQYEEDQPITTEAPEITSTTEYTVTRRPLNSRGRTRLQNTELNPTTPRTRTRVSSAEVSTIERRPINRGRRPGPRHRTTTPQPTFDEQFQKSQEDTGADFVNETPSNQQFLKETTNSKEQQYVEQRDNPTFEAQGQTSKEASYPEPSVYQRPHKQDEIQSIPVQPIPNPPQDLPVKHSQPNRGHFSTQSPNYQDSFSAQAEIDSYNYDNLRNEPQKHSSNRQQELQHARQRPEDVSQTPYFTTSEPSFHRSRPALIQPVVSSTPESLLQHSPTPYVSTPAYPTESQSITPHHVSKGEVGKVQQPHNNLPFIPTPLPDYPSEIIDQRVQVTPTATVESAHQQFGAEVPEITTFAPIEEVPATQQSYQTPSRPRTRLQPNSEAAEPVRHRSRHPVESSDQNSPIPHTSPRLRGRVQSTREDTSDEAITTLAPIQRVRTRLHASRVRTTDAPSLQITVTESARKQPIIASEESNTEPPQRTRGRFRTAERSRTPSARQQVIRSRQPTRQQENDGLDLVKPVRQNIGLTTEAADVESPVYVPDVQFESGFIPSVDAQKQPPSTTEATEPTTVRPGRGRFNNFGTGARGSQRRPQARTTASQDATTSTPVSSGRVFTGRGSRRQQATQAPSTRVTHVRGGRIRRPNAAATTTETAIDEEPIKHIPTGVTYVKNPYVTIHRGNSEPQASKDQEPQNVQVNDAPDHAKDITRQRQRRPQVDKDEYVEQPATQYDANPADPEYQQYYSSQPNRAAERQEQYFTETSASPVPKRPGHKQEQFFTESSPSPTPIQSGVRPEQYFQASSPSPVQNRAGNRNEQYFTESSPSPASPRSGVRQEQYFQAPSPVPNRSNERQEQFYTASTPSPRQLVATPSPLANQQFLREETPQQYEPEEYEYQPQPQRQQRKRTKNPARFDNLDDPEYGEESQRSEQISIQQLEGALAASLFNKGVEVVDVIPSSEGSEHIVDKEEENYTEKYEKDANLAEIGVTTETIQTSTDEITTISNDEEISQTTPAEPEQTTAKPSPHSKPSEGRRRRIRIRTRKQRPGDVFETAESQNVASVATNLLSGSPGKEKKINEAKLQLSNYPTIDVPSNKPEANNYNIYFTTPMSDPESDYETSTQYLEEETKESTTTDVPITTTTELATTQEAESTTESITTTDVPESSTPRVLGTSTTTEISLETEICYRGRCVKTKVDADQVPIE